MTKIFILILNFNGGENTVSCLDSLKGINIPKGTQIETIVIDNNSTDGSVEKIGKKHADVKILQTGGNLGFTGGNNYGINYALKNEADYIVILNNDTRMHKDTIKNLYLSFENNDKEGMILPKIYFEKDYEFHKKRYKDDEKGKVIWYAGGVMDWNNLMGENRGVDEVDHGQFDMREEIDLATGCCFMVKTKVIDKVGMFDEKFFLYYEDADFSQKIKKAGFKIIYEPKAIMWHKNAESTGGSGSSLQDYFISRNRLLFGMRYAPLRTKIALFRESLKLLKSGREWQKKGVKDYYLKRFGRGSFNI